MVGILVSFWDGLFSGAMLVLGGVPSWELSHIPMEEENHRVPATFKRDVIPGGYPFLRESNLMQIYGHFEENSLNSCFAWVGVI